MKKRAAIIFFGTVAGLLLATVFVLQSGPFENWLRRRVQGELRSELNSDVKIAKLRVRLLSLQPGVDLYDVAITPRLPGAMPRFEEPTLRADRIGVVLRLVQPWARSLDIDRIELDGPHADLEVRGGKIIGLPTTITDPPEGVAQSSGSMKLRIDTFLVKNGILHLKLDEPDSEFGLTRIRALGTIEPNGSIVVDLESTGRRVRMRLGDGDFEEFITELNGQIAIHQGSGESPDGARTGGKFSGEGPDGARTGGESSGGQAGVGKTMVEIRSSRIVAGEIEAEASGIVELGETADVKLASLRLVAPLEYVNEIAADLPMLRGRLDWIGSLSVVSGGAKSGGSGRITPDGPRVRARGTARIPDFRLDRFKLGEVEADIDLVGRRARARRLVLRHAGGTVEGTGQMSWPEGELRLAADVELNQVSFARILDGIGVDGAHVDARLDGPLRFEGPLAPMALEGEALLAHHSFTWRDRPWDAPATERVTANLRVPAGRIGGKFLVEPDGIRFSDLEGAAGSSRLRAHGELDFAGAADLSFTCAPLALGELSPLGAVKVAGTGPARGRVHGPFENLVIEGNLDLDGLKVAEFDFGRGAGSILFEDLVLSSGRTEFVRGTSAYAGPWAVDFNDPLSLEFDVETREARIEDLADIIWSSFPASAYAQGEVTGNIRLAGPIDALSGRYDVSAAQVTVAGERFARILGKGRWRNGTIWADDLVATKESGARLFARGSLAPTGSGQESLGGAVNVEIHSSRLTLSDLDFMGPDPSLTSEMGLRVRIGGHFFRPEFGGRLDLGGTRYLGALIGASQADFETIASGNGPDAVRDLLRVEANLAGGSLQADARIRLDLENGLPFDADVLARRHSFKPYFYELNPQLAREEDVSALLSGQARLSGGLTRLSEVEVSATIAEARLARGRHGLRTGQPFSFYSGGGRLELRDFVLEGDETNVRIAGSRAADGRLDFHADGSVDLAFLPLITDKLKRVEGIAHLRSLALRGRTGEVDLDGMAEIEGGVFKNRYFPMALEDVTARIRIEEDRVVFEQVRGRANGGTFEASRPGILELDGPAVRHWDLAARLTDVPLRFPSVMLGARGSGEIEFAGPSSNPILSGDVHLSEARFTAPFDWKAKAVSWKQARQVYAAPSEDARLFGLDLVLHAEKNIWVKNELLNMEWRIRKDNPLVVVGDTAQWGLLGTIELLRGKAVFQGDREFTVTSGELKFDDPRGVDGGYQIRAMTLLRDWEVDATVKGRISTEPVIDYSATPDLPKKDITFLLLTGMTNQEANDQGGAVAVNILSTIAAQGLGEQRGLTGRIKEAIALDSVEIVPSYSEGGQLGFKAVGRKQLNPDLTVSGSVGHSGQDRTTGNFQAEYRVNKRLHLVGGWTNEDNTGDPTQGGELLDQGEVSLDAKFRFEWK